MDTFKNGYRRKVGADEAERLIGKTVTVAGIRYRCTGVGSSWRIRNEDDYSLHGIAPHEDYMCYAYYELAK